MVSRMLNKSRLNMLKILIVCFVILGGFLLGGCFVTPAAWLRLKIDGGYVYYSSNMHASGGAHIYYYENEEDYHNRRMGDIEITFYPRILGAEDVEVDGETVRTTLVDISRYADIHITISKHSSVYSASKKVYLNGEYIEPTNIYDGGEYIVSYTFEDVSLIRGNPNGRINGAVNVIEYK